MRNAVVGLIVIVITGVLITLLALLHSTATQTTFLVALDELLLSGLGALWNLVAQPFVAGAIAVLVLLRVFFPSGGGLLSILEELTASIGPFSLKGKLDRSQLFSQVEADAQPVPMPEKHPPIQEISDVISRMDPIISMILVDIANKQMSEQELLNFVSQRLLSEGTSDRRKKALVTGFAAGIIKSLNGIVLQYSGEKDDDDLEVIVTIDKSILELLYDRVKAVGLEGAPPES